MPITENSSRREAKRALGSSKWEFINAMLRWKAEKEFELALACKSLHTHSIYKYLNLKYDYQHPAGGWLYVGLIFISHRVLREEHDDK